MDQNLVWLDIRASYSHSSLALPAIESTRIGDSYLWQSVRGTINSDIFQLTKELYKSKPTILAGTVWLFNHEIMISVCERIKRLIPDLVIILGGPEFNGDNHRFLRRNSFVDYVFCGEGEIEFHKWLRGDNPATITGLCYIDGLGVYRDNGTAKVEDFSALPAPETSNFFNFSAPFVQIECSRGCFNNCAFCVSGGDKPIRNKPVEEIEQRINDIRDKGVKDIRILDRTFNYSPIRAKELLNMFAKFTDMNFHLEIHPALLTDELCELLSSTPKGLLHLEAGMQSLDDRVIEASGRIGTTEAAMHGLTRLCSMDNFETHADLIAGLPYYTLEQIFADVRSLSLVGAGEIQLELLKLLPGTKMQCYAAHLEIKYAPTPPYEVLETPDISIIELDRARFLSRLIDRFYNAKGWQSVTRRLINENVDFLDLFLDFLMERSALDKPISLERCGTLLYAFCKTDGYDRYSDDISLAWISNGLSLRREEAGNITRANELPNGMERNPNTHYYLWQGSDGKSVIVAYNRSESQAKPLIIEIPN
ncbi:MAG: DUF4080 domain-containing protein [Bacteroidales bacterium]